MLQTEDIEDDYFTPASSTTLANIFGKSRNDVAENESLKYTPPKPTKLTEKTEEQKPTKCIFACALMGYEWCNGAYVTRGNVGFAILNIVQTGGHNLIIYDASKVTLSSTTISANLEVTLKGNTYFSYLDDMKRYWSLYTTVDKVSKIIDMLKGFNVKIKESDEDVNVPLESSKTEASAFKENHDKVLKESDTDSSIDHKTKMSIINRMANMGQSVLPTRVTTVEKSSDSSDTNDTIPQKTVRHKPIKNVKKNTPDKSLVECQTLVETKKIIPRTEHSAESMPLFTYVNGQLVPVTNTNIFTNSSNNSGNDMTFYLSEQRINNSELRININRISDKIDQVLSTVSNIDSGDKGNSSNFQIDLLQKLLVEYENKIKVYEEFIKKSNPNINPTKLLVNPSQQEFDNDLKVNELKDKIEKLEQLCRDKDSRISTLESEIEDLKIKYDDTVVNGRLKMDELSQNVLSLKHDIEVKNKEYSVLTNRYENLTSQIGNKDDENDIGCKIKKVMNDTFHAISANFENSENYTGERIKSVTATVIKRVTVETLSTIK